MVYSNRIEIYYAWKYKISPAFSPLLSLTVLSSSLSRHLQILESYRHFGIAFAYLALIVYAISIYRQSKIYLVIADDGVSVTGWRKVLWKDVQACAVEPGKGRRVLRLFVNRDSAWARTGMPYVDIDFRKAQNADASLDLALRACASRIEAGNPRPVRPFIDDPATAAAARPLGPRFMWGFAIAVAVCTGLAVWAYQRPVIHERPMPVDARSAKTVLMLGNSRITVNDLGWTIRDMADSAHSPIRWDFSMLSWASSTLREHWKFQGDHDALDKGYDYVILQPESGAFENDYAAADTFTYGRYLIGAAKKAGSLPLLLSGPSRGEQAFEGDAPARGYAVWEYGKRIDEGARKLSENAQAGMIDLTGAFEEARHAVPQVALSDGGTNPSHAGTYLMALMIYRNLSHDDLAHVIWRPYDLALDVAETYKMIAMRRGG